MIFDSYLELSLKGSDRNRRACGIGAVDMDIIGADVPIPQQMDKFWPSLRNKTELQRFTWSLAIAWHSHIPIILSGSISDNEVVPAVLISPDTACQY